MASGTRPIEGASPEGRRLLGALLGQRRKELGYTHRPAFARERLPLTPNGNLNTRLLADIEEAYRDTFPEDTLRQLAQAYLVAYDSLAAVAHLRARALAPVPQQPPTGSVTQLPPMTDAVRRGADFPYFTRIEKRLRELAAAGFTDPDGTQVFLLPSPVNESDHIGSPGDAKAWDGIGARLDIDDRAWLIADLQRRADGRDGGALSAPVPDEV
jgi:hypothetical protein